MLLFYIFVLPFSFDRISFIEENSLCLYDAALNLTWKSTYLRYAKLLILFVHRTPSSIFPDFFALLHLVSCGTLHLEEILNKLSSLGFHV